MLDTNGTNSPTLHSENGNKLLSHVIKSDSNKQRGFLKDKHQLETVLGPSKTLWFDELTERAIVAKRETVKYQLSVFDSPLRSPTVSQLIKNHLKVGQSPPEFYHSSPAVVGKNLQDDSLNYTPDSLGHWQRPILGISPSPVHKDGSFYQKSSMAVSSLGFCNDDSTLSWTNSLATPPRIEDSVNESIDEKQSRHKDPVRALFSPAPGLDTTTDSIEVLESTYEDDNEDGSFTKHEDCTKQESGDTVLHSERETFKSKQGKTSASVLPSRRSMDSWKENLKRKFLLKSDSFGKNCSLDRSPNTIKCDKLSKSPVELFLEPGGQIDNEYSKGDNDWAVGKRDESAFSGNCSCRAGQNKPSSHTVSFGPKICKEECISPVFPKTCSVKKSKELKSEVKRKREFKDSGVDEALSDFFDPPSSAVGKRNTSILNRKRKSSELNESEIKQSFTEVTSSTPKQTVLHSILINDKYSRSSSGKKVRFSACVMKYSEQKAASERYKKKRKKNVKVLEISDVEKSEIKVKPSNDKEAHLEVELNDVKPTVIKIETEKVENDNSNRKSSNIYKSIKTIPTLEKGYCESAKKGTVETENEDVFSQVSPSALEEMCDAAKVANDNETHDNLVTNIKPGNSGDFARNNLATKPKRFLYPSKRKIAVASPSAVFKFREDEKCNSKAKGIVMAIQADNILAAKKQKPDDKETNDKQGGSESKTTFKHETKSEDELPNETGDFKNHSVNTFLGEDCRSGAMVANVVSEDKSGSCVGFLSASGKRLEMSDSAVEKAKRLLDEENVNVTDKSPNASWNMDSKTFNQTLPTPRKDMTVTKRYDEDFDFSEWCEDFDINQENIVADTVLEEMEIETGERKAVVCGKWSEKEEETVEKMNNQLTVTDTTVTKGETVNDKDGEVTKNQEGSVRNDINETALVCQGLNIVSQFMDNSNKNLLGECSEISPYPQVSKSSGFGFTLASGKTLNFDTSKLKKAEELLEFSHGSLETVSMNEKQIASDLQTVNVNSKDISLDLKCNSKQSGEHLRKMAFAGFATASGKDLNLSDTAIKKAEDLLKDNEGNNCELKKVQTDVALNIQTKQKISDRKQNAPLHEIFKTELNVGTSLNSREESSLNDELEFLKRMKTKNDADVDGKTFTIITKYSPVKLPETSLKPKGFRPFKAPKSTEKKSKYPPSVNKPTENPVNSFNECRTSEILGLENKTDTREKCISNEDNVSKPCGDSLTNPDSGQERTNNLTGITDESNCNTSANNDVCNKPRNDVCEGIFSQMFADEMELDGANEVKESEEVIAVISGNSEVESGEKLQRHRYQKCDTNSQSNENVKADLLSYPEKAYGNDIRNRVACNDRTCQGFTSANVKQVVVSKDAFEKAKHTLEGDTDDNIPVDWFKALPEPVAKYSFNCQERENLPESNVSAQPKIMSSNKETVNKSSVSVSKSVSHELNKLFDAENKIVKEQTNGDMNYVSINTCDGVTEQEITKSSSEDAGNADQNDCCLDVPNSNQHCTLGNTFKGFQTARGASIKTSESALLDAKRKFLTAVDTVILSKSECENEENVAGHGNNENLIDHGFQTSKGTHLAVTEKVLEAATNKCKETDVGQDLNTVTVSEKSLDASLDKFNHIKDTIQTAGFKGFHTAGGAVIHVSETSLEAVRDGFKEMDVENEFSKSVIGGFQTAKSAPIPVSSEALEVVRNKYDTEAANETFVMKGFLTANGTDISVSENALEDAKKRFKESNDDIKLNQSPFIGFKTAEKTPMPLLEEANNEYKSIENVTDKKVIKGFQTAGGKHISVSDKALEVARHTLKDAEEIKGLTEMTDDISPNESILKGFQTAKGTHVSVSEKALEVARKGLTEPIDEMEFKMPIMKGFQTAKGTHVYVSEKSLEVDRNTLKNADDNVNAKVPIKVGFQTAKGSHVGVSDEALETARHCLKESDNDINSKIPIMKGFQTAKGTCISVSEKALEEARNSLKDTDDDTHLNTDKPVLKGFQTAKGTPVSVSEKALKAARGCLEEVDDNLNLNKPIMKGFQTAKGTHISVSEKALEAVRTSFKDTEDVTRERTVKGFQTAKGTNVSVSEKALEAARSTLKDTDTENSTIFDKPVMKGFQTARGANVSVSANALSKAKETLSSLDEENMQHDIGFQTAAGSKVHLSEIALLEAKERVTGLDSVYDDKELYQDKNISELSETNFVGFQTAKGKTVGVSTKALQFVQEQLGQDTVDGEPVNNVKTNFKGFQTAKGSEVSVSEKALMHARGQLNECMAEGQTVGKDGLQSKSVLELEEETEEELDSDLPLKRQKLGHHREKGILHQSGITGSVTIKRKPLRSTPEGTTTDRRHPGFRPFKPVRSCQLEKQNQRRNNMTVSTGSAQESKSVFQTPYKTTNVTKQGDLTPENKEKIDAKVPVFHSRSKPKVPESKVTTGTVSDLNKHAVDNDASVARSEKGSSRKLTLEHNPINDICNVKDSISSFIEPKDLETIQSLETPHNVLVTHTESDIKVSKSHDLDLTEVALETNDLGSFSQDEDDVFYCNIVDARRQQEDIIKAQKGRKIEPVCGRLYQLKKGTVGRFHLRDVINSSSKQKEKKRIHVTSTTAADFKFQIKDYYGNHTAHVLLGDGAFLVPNDEGRAGKQEFYRAFMTMDGVDHRLVNEAWIGNHYRWIVWKLAAYEMAGPFFTGRSLTPENVMLQLKYRYDREIDRTERSCLKRIYERDDAASKRLVLCVSAITYGKNNIPNTESTNVLKSELTKVEVELTDGWYRIAVQLDGPLINMVHAGRITVGRKLCISGAELVGGEDACTPLEAPASIHLKINTNATRPARWDCVLGYQSDPSPLCAPLISLFDEGGTVGVIDVVIVRKYPTMYMEKLAAGGCLFRCSRDEERAQQLCQSKKQIGMEKLYNQIQAEIEMEQRQDKKQGRSSKKYSKQEIEEMMSGEEIHEAIDNSAQPDMIQNYLSGIQQSLLFEHQRTVQEGKRHELAMRVQDAWREKEEEIPTERNVTPVLKFRVAGCANTDLDCKATTILTVWRPATEISELKEGKRYRIYSLNTSTSRSKYTGSSVQLTATKQTKFMHREINENLLDHIYEPREVLWVNDVKRTQPPYGEFDFVGLIVKKVSAETRDSFRSPDMFYLADCQSNLIGVKFWTGIKSFGGDSITEGTCICISNLMDKSPYRNKHMLSVEATTEFTNITLKPQNSGQRQALDKLRSVMKDKGTFTHDALMKVEELLHGKAQITPEKNQRPIETAHSYPSTTPCIEHTKTATYVTAKTKSPPGNDQTQVTNPISNQVDRDTDRLVKGDTDINSVVEIVENNTGMVKEDKNVTSEIKVDKNTTSVCDIDKSITTSVDEKDINSEVAKDVTSINKVNTNITSMDEVEKNITSKVDKDMTSVHQPTLNESLPVTPSSQTPRQKSTKARLARLSAYAMPDNLSPLPVSVPRTVSQGFKPPTFKKKLN